MSVCSGEKKVIMSCPSKLAVDPKGRLFVLNQGEKKIQVSTLPGGIHQLKG